MSEYRSYPMAFHGKGDEFFKIQIVNAILCVITLGLYYPWAKEKTLKYLYSKNTFDETPFVFSGTGKEMFKGFIKALVIFIALYAALFLVPYFGGLIFLIGLFVIMPLAIHGSYKYRMAKTSWRGIRFGYTGSRKELVMICIKGMLLTLITFGIYGSWFAMDLRRYVLSNIKVGNAHFTYTGTGTDFFGVNFKGYILTLLTFGIYWFWWQKDLFEFLVNNLRIEQGDDAVFFRSTATGGGFAGLMIGNALITIFTLGLGYAWTVTRTLNFIMSNMEAKGYYSFEELQQSQEEYSDATGDDMADMLDFGFVI